MIGVPELMFILVIVLILFGPGKLPKIGSALGEGIAEFKKASSGLQSGSDRKAIGDESDPKTRPVDAVYTNDPHQKS